MNGRTTPQSMIRRYLEDNGPSTIKDMAEGISNEYKQDLTCKELTNYVRMMNGHNEIEAKGRHGSVTVWGLPTTIQA